MRFVFTSYVFSPQFNDPQAWLNRIDFYTGILQELAKTHTVISIEQICYEGDYTCNGVQYLFRMFSKFERRFPFRQHRIIKNLHPDVVVVQGLHFPAQLIQLRNMLGGKVKIMVQNHAEQPFNGFKKLLQQLADRRVNAYFFASACMGSKWISRGNLASPDKIYEVMEVSSVFAPVNSKAASSKTGITHQPAFLWVGRLNKNKDPITVVSAFLKFTVQNPAAMLYMIYQKDDLLPELKQLLEDHPAAKQHIKLIGRIPHADLLYWYNSAGFYISGSHYEGSGAAICEAMSCGCIPVVTGIDAFRMITDNGRCGILYEPGNMDDLFDALMKTNEINIQATRAAVLDRYHSTLSFSAIARRFAEVAASLS